MRIRLLCNFATLHYELLRPLCSQLIVVVNRRKRFARIYPIINFLAQNDPDRWIDGVFLALTASAKNHARRPDLLTLHGSYVACLFGWHHGRVPGFRKLMR